ncbi:MAG: hypothetical protein SOV75_08265, partial [Candidatus Limiplasma sp.]|nr:hypothetical protein [Candidatus Limiplasma sp.]
PNSRRAFPTHKKTFREAWRARRPSKVISYRPALPGGRGVCASWRKHFLSIWRKRPPQANFFDKLKRPAAQQPPGIFVFRLFPPLRGIDTPPEKAYDRRKTK